jgi:hypothetical protein
VSEEAIRELTASIILGVYRSNVDKYNTLEKIMGDYYKILNMITPKLNIDLGNIDLSEISKE